MPFDASLIEDAVARYHRERDRYVKLADRVAQICRDEVCEKNAIRAQITFRVKSEKSFEGKLKRFSQEDHRNYRNVSDIFGSISDLAGVRIAAYREEDCEKIVKHLCQEFKSSEAGIALDRKDKKSPEGENYYRAIHAQISLPEEDLVGTYDNVGDISCEVQICTMIAHVWNEIEHDIGYKPEGGDLSDSEQFYLSLLGRLVRQGDLTVSALLLAHEKRMREQSVETKDNSPLAFKNVHDFVSHMMGAWPELKDFAENSGQLFDMLVELDLANPVALGRVLEDFDPDAAKKKIVEFNRRVAEADIQGLRLDGNSSDLLLVGLLEKKSENVLEKLQGRAGRGRGRPSRLHRVAKWFKDFKLSE